MRTGAKTIRKILAILLVIALAMGALMLTACKPKDDDEPVPWEHLFGTYQFAGFKVKQEIAGATTVFYEDEAKLAEKFPRGSAEFEYAMEGFNQLGQKIVIDKNGIAFSGINFNKTFKVEKEKGGILYFDKNNEANLVMKEYARWFFSRETNRYSMGFERTNFFTNEKGEKYRFSYSYIQK